ncbi:MAG: hypothetical protein Q9190_006715, partial [Brigantiaea leucoxantha]
FLPAVAVPAEVMSFIQYPDARMTGMGIGGSIYCAPNSDDEEQRKNRKAEHGYVVFHMVDDVGEKVEKVRSMGLDVVKEKTEAGPTGWQAVVRDTEGNLVGMYEERKEKEKD